MSSTTLRPLLRRPSCPSTTSISSSSTSSSNPFNHTQLQRRHITEIIRPQRPQRFEQIVILSDGSSYKQLTTSPQGIFRSSKDIRNHILWNPTSEKLANVEEDEAGRLRRFREKFGTGFDAMKAAATKAGDTKAIKRMEEGFGSGKGMEEWNMEAWEGGRTVKEVARERSERRREEKIEEAIGGIEGVTEEKKEAAPVAKEEERPVDDNLFGLISGTYQAPSLTDFGRRARRAKRNAKKGDGES